MKRLILFSYIALILVILIGNNLYAAVDIRMRFVSSVPNTPVVGQETLTMYVQAKSVGSPAVAHEISYFQYAFKFGEDLWNALPGITDAEKYANVTIQHTFLRPSTVYTHTVTEMLYRIWRIRYTLVTGQTPVAIPSDRWIRISKVTVVFNIQENVRDNIFWPNTPVFNVLDAEDPPNDVTGAKQEQLLDISLPVEMAMFQALLEQQNGRNVAHLQWRTASETDCAGFYLERCDAGEFGEFRQISGFIDGQGTTTEATDYEFLDDRNISFTENPDENSGIWYQIVQKDLDGIEEVFGPFPITKAPPLPQAFLLDQNFPNPFNPITLIPYALPEEANVKVEIYNLLGRKVKTVVDARQEAGEHTAVWNGLNESGTSMGSGVYFYKLTAGNTTLTKKMTLLR
ncbi:T9SS type A sorting domain-containing protein [candidate division KSB1 bacterium]|nr:T9SS type A sorting domain-containing protein [candidate division KSB1 bacterium]